MSRGKHLSLEEARKDGNLKQFAKEHPTKGNAKLFERLLNEAAKDQEEAPKASSRGSSAGCSGTRTRRGS